MTAEKDVTALLLAWSNGEGSALEKLMPLVYQELHQLADRYLRRERANHTIQATALVHEAYLRLIDQRSVNWKDRAHFFAVAVQLMRRILVDHARAHKAEKRGGGNYTLALDEAIGVVEREDLDLVALDEALNTLAEKDPKKSRVIELRFFGGLTLEETAAVMDLSLSTIKSDWRMARAWLFQEIKRKS